MNRLSELMPVRICIHTSVFRTLERGWFRCALLAYTTVLRFWR